MALGIWLNIAYCYPNHPLFPIRLHCVPYVEHECSFCTFDQCNSLYKIEFSEISREISNVHTSIF